MNLETPGPVLWKPPSSPAGLYQEHAWRLEVLRVLIAPVLAPVSSVCSASAALGRCPSLLLTSGAFRPGLSVCKAADLHGGEVEPPLLEPPPLEPHLSCTWCPAAGAHAAILVWPS